MTFYGPFQVFQDLRFSCQFQEVLKFPPFWGIFFSSTVQQPQTLVFTKMRAVCAV